MNEQKDGSATAGTPRWVKVFALIAVVVAVLFVVGMLVGGDHGPGRHSSSGDASAFTVAGLRHEPPAGGHPV